MSLPRFRRSSKEDRDSVRSDSSDKKKRRHGSGSSDGSRSGSFRIKLPKFPSLRRKPSGSGSVSGSDEPAASASLSLNSPRPLDDMSPASLDDLRLVGGSIEASCLPQERRLDVEEDSVGKVRAIYF